MEIAKECIYEVSADEAPSEAELDVELKCNNYLRTHWLSSFVAEIKGQPNSVFATVKRILNSKFTCVTIFADTTKFILSDNPVIYNIGKNADSLIGGGLYMPISPNTLIAFLDCCKWGVATDDMVVFKANDNFVKYINRKLLNQAFEQVGFYTIDIAKNFAAEGCKKTGMKEMFSLVD